MDKPNQSDIQQRNTALEGACATLMCNIRELGEGAIPQGMIPHAPTRLTGGDLQYNHDLESYHAQLAGLLAGRHAPNLRKAGATSAATGATAPAPAQPASVTASAPAALTGDEVKALSWTERVQYAGGKLSAEILRARIAERAKAKESSNAKAPSALSQVLKARGVESVQALAALPARNLD